MVRAAAVWAAVRAAVVRATVRAAVWAAVWAAVAAARRLHHRRARRRGHHLLVVGPIIHGGALGIHPADRLLHLLSRALRRALGVVGVMDVPADAFEGRGPLHAIPTADRIIYRIKLHEADEFAIPVFPSPCDLKADKPTKVAL